MRDLPSGAALLALARATLLEDLAPLLPDAARVKARLVATCMAVAEREAAVGEGLVGPILDQLHHLYFADDAAPSPRVRGAGRGEGSGPAAEPLRRLALDLRKGAFETSQSQEHAARAILWRLTIAKLREGNPSFLAANGIAGS